MIELRNIRKQYTTGSLVQQALDGVSLCFREQEMVAILGPSGSGKTTLLNILGGLDRYDSGDLIVDGVSTKEFTDRDWDTYRNDTIGFVFQGYNLISHQTVLSNVEIALTISGISKGERRRRAKEALEQVGLGAHIHKRPSQLSGGQMQRVAIARALINNPRIILADEPTGALDSDTSVQIMDILKKVAQKHLVIMVTHNGELAGAYADRIVTIKDGKIREDSAPFVPPVSDDRKEKQRGRKAGMTFLTALSLSFNNLRTKKKRTALVSLAGSIGLIGIAVVLALTNGVNNYIRYIEETTVLKYPITITKSGVNYASYMTMFSEMEDTGYEDSSNVKVKQILHSYAGGITSNDVKHLVEYLESGESEIDTYAAAVEYSYDVVPNIYRVDDAGTRRVNPEESLTDLNMTYSSAKMLGLTAFDQLPENEFLYTGDYDVKAGHWPENENECVLVLGEDGTVTDTVLYAAGLRDNEELNDMAAALLSGDSVAPVDDIGVYTYEDFLGITFKVTGAGAFYQYDKENKVWVDHSDEEDVLEEVLAESPNLTIAGVVQPKEDSEEAMLESGIYYTKGMVDSLIARAADSEIVKAQLADPDTNVFTGEAFGVNKDIGDLDLSDFFSFDESALTDAFSTEDLSLDTSDMFSGLNLSGFDLSGIDLSGMDLSGIDLSGLADSASFSEEDLKNLMSSISFDVSAEDAQALFQTLLDGYLAESGEESIIDTDKLKERLVEYLNSGRSLEIIRAYLEEVFSTDITLPDAPKEDMTPEELQALAEEYAKLIREELLKLESFDAAELGSRLASDFMDYLQEILSDTAAELMGSFADYISRSEVQEEIMDFVTSHMDTSGASEQIAQMMTQMSSGISSAVQSAVSSMMTSLADTLSQQISQAVQEYASALGSSLTDTLDTSLSSVFDLDEDTIANAISVSMTAEELQKTLAAFISGSSDSYENNLLKAGYANLDEPTQIDIYPKNFESKTEIENILTGYNTRMEDEGLDERVVSYNDMAGFMMDSVQQIINVVSTVMIALVAISLVVSSIMIGVLTHISVLERRKEIGILRAIGASKHNISEIFNAENFITGLASGTICIVGTLLLLIPVNALIHYVVERNDVSAYLPPLAGVLLVLLGIGLNLISGLIPAKKAADSDPVSALRDE